MTRVDIDVWLVAGYAVFLVVVAYGFDHLALRVARRSARWRSGAFTYHADHDAWVCPQDQWLWPTTFDPQERTMRYRANPVVCNSCPVKETCTTSSHGREITREVDPWPHSEAGRFHRGIAVCIATLAVAMPLGMALGRHTPPDLLVLLGCAVLCLLAAVPLARHLWRTPDGFPEHVPHQVGPTPHVEALIDRYSTRWGFADSSPAKSSRKDPA